MESPLPTALLIAGPTAVGKSDLALSLAEELGGEIVSVDSMQVYRGLDIGTAKPPAADRARVPHHLIDVLDLSENYNASDFVRMAEHAIAGIRSRGKLPILCGGTGLYFKALLEGIGKGPATDWALRAELAQLPPAALLEELARKDPAAYQRIDRNNPRRLLRAVEVIRLTGRPFSEQRASWEAAAPASTEWLMLGLTRPQADLHERIETRVDRMFELGLVAETQALLKQGLAENKTAMQAIGYRQVVEFLDGVRSLPETVALVKTRTRRYAKKQYTWFRRQMQLRWFELGPNTKNGEVLSAIRKLL